MNDRSTLLSQITRESLIDLVPGLQELLLDHGEIRVYEANQKVAVQGEVSNHLFIPISESLRLIHNQPGTTETTLIGYLQKQRSLGLKEILEGKRYTYDAICEATTTVVCLDASLFAEHIRKQPLVENYLILINSSSALRNLRRALTDRKIETSQIFNLFSKIRRQTINVPKNGLITDKEPLLYFVKRGQLQIFDRSEQHTKLCDIGEGTWFGGEALVPPHRLTYQASAFDDTTLHVAPYADLSPLLKSLNLIEFFYDEQWINRESQQYGQSTGIITPLPGRPIKVGELSERKLSLNPSIMRGANSDNESTIASLISLCNLLNLPVNTSSIVTELKLQKKVSFLKIAEALESFGIVVRPLRTSFLDLPNQNLPGLVAFGPRVCVILGANESSVALHDPVRGSVVVDRLDFEANWNEVFLEITRSEFDRPKILEGSKKNSNREKEDKEEKKINENKIVRDAFLKIFFRLKKVSWNVLGLSACTFILGLIIPQFYQGMLDEVLTLKDTHILWIYVIGILLTLACQILVLVLKMRAVAEFSIRFDQKISSLFYRHALSVSSRTYSSQRVGSVMARLREIWNIRQFLSGSSINSVTDVVSLVIYAAILAFYSWKVAILAFSLLPATILIRLAFRNRMKRAYEESFEADSTSTSLVTEQIAAIATVKAAGAEEVMRHRWENAFLNGVQLKRSNQLQATALQGFISFFSSTVRLGCLWLACSLALEGELSPGAIMAVTMYLDNVMSPIGNIANLFSEIEQVKVAFRKLADVFSTAQEQPPTVAIGSHSMVLKGKIKFDRVNFRYDENSPWVLRDISLTIYPNQVVAIVGRSGCGKTTLANVIANNLRPTSGRLFFDDFDSSFLSLSCLRQQTGFIMQSSELFAGSIGENIAFCDDVPDFERTERAATEANAVGFITQFPTGYKQFLAEGGLGLSGGQKQRVSIARSLYRAPRVLIMDEATSALDAESERAIMENMQEILKGKTAIVIAHRLSTIKNADRIIVMKDGEVVEEGTHSTLIKQGSYYAELFENQMAGGEV